VVAGLATAGPVRLEGTGGPVRLEGTAGPVRLDGTVAVDARYLRRSGVGIAVVVASMIDELRRSGARLVLVTDDQAAGAALRRAYPDAAVEVVARAMWLWWEQVRLARLLWARKPDVFVAPANVGIPLVHPRRTRTIVVVHDLIPLVLWRHYLMPRVRWAASYVVATACAMVAADDIVAVSDATASDLARLTGRRSTVIHPPIPARRSSGQPRRRGHRPYVLFHGGLDQRKNLFALLEAFAIFSRSAAGARFDLVVMGASSEELPARLRGLGIAEKTRLIGLVPDRWKWAWIERAACIAYPSTYEGFGLVVVEGFAAGVPVVTGTGGSLREVGANAVVTVDPSDAASIADGLRQATDPARAARLIQSGYEQLERLRGRSGGFDRFLAGLVNADQGRGGPLRAACRDSGQRNSGPRDAGPRDAGSRDAGSRDAGSRDAGPGDAGPFVSSEEVLAR
jgi:glycosyltransferase involved in cell wall biosynthesis